MEDCGSTIKGKNATNLVNHLKSKHKETAVEMEMEKKKKEEQWQKDTADY